jgi:S1-C subfamily serine protease
VNWVDILIVAIVAVAALRGWYQGAVRQTLGWLGFVVGFLVGAMIAPSLSTHLTHATWRPVLAVGIVLVVAYIGHFAGHMLGSVVRNTIKMIKLGVVDSGVGVVVGVAGALLTCWLIAALLVATPWPTVASGVQGSSIVNALDKALPPVPSFEARLQTIIRNADFPSVFASVVAPTVPSSGPAPKLGANVAHETKPTNILKVVASGCSAEHEGTSFVVGSHEVVTNAHVVAGATAITVGGVPATVAFFDPVNDLAVLRVPSLTRAPLRLAHATPTKGTKASVIGFPLDASRTLSPAVVSGQITAQSRDIYDGQLFNRAVLVLYVNVEPGNSGSPVLAGGHVVGVLFSKSLSQSETGYAIPSSTVQHDLAVTPAKGLESTQRCVN